MSWAAPGWDAKAWHLKPLVSPAALHQEISARLDLLLKSTVKPPLKLRNAVKTVLAASAARVAST